MAIKKYTSGAWVPTNYRKYGTETDIITSLPAQIIGDGQPITSCQISGNTLQNGTPTPDSPVDVVGCGVRTGNLFDESNFALVQVTSTAYRYGTSLGVLPQGTYTFNATKSAYAQSVYLTAKLNDVYSQTTISSVPFTFTADGISEYIIRTADHAGTTWMAKGYSDTMLNLGSTALPYAPYGYKLTLTVNDTEHPIYLGQVETTRRIKKLALTGDETWAIDGGKVGLYSVTNESLGITAPIQSYAYQLSSHFVLANSYNTIFYNTGYFAVQTARLIISYFAKISVESFKSYLAQQYAAGTPVTVWYVLAEPETAIVNEPLHKIGNYADTVAAENIPTTGIPENFDVLTTLKPSEVQLTYHGWHEYEDTKYTQGE